MNRLIITDSNSRGTHTSRERFGSEGPTLTFDGKRHATSLGKWLRLRGIDTNNETVAVSEMVKSSETAMAAGFRAINSYMVLNDPISRNLTIQELIAIGRGNLNDEIMKSANALAENPPEERIWISGGFIIAGLSAILGIQNQRAVPRACEIIEMDI